MALASDRIRSTAIEAREFSEMAQRFQVSGVPTIVVNDEWGFVGGLPEPMFVDSVLQGLQGTGPG